MKRIVVLALLCTVSAIASAADPKQAFIDSTFSAMDTNADGRIDKAEYSSFQQMRFKNQSRAVDAAFKELDKDNDGKVSKTEATAVPEIARYFDGLDTDKDGFLSLEEMQRAMVAAQTAETPTK